MASDGLRIFTNRGPAEVTRILEVEPTEIRKARRADGPPEHRWVWLWKTELEDTEPFDAHAAAFIAQFRSRAERLRQLTTDSVVELRTGYAAALGQGGITLEPDLIALLAAMGAGVCLDLYPPQAAYDLSADLPDEPAD
jgi:hypothetical protein